MADEIHSGKPFAKKNVQKIIALFFWAGVIAAYQWYARANDLTAFEVAGRLLGFMTNAAWGPVVYVILYAVRPLILFPSTVLTLAGGFVFGPVLGVLYTIIASNLSSTIAYFVGRYFGEGLLKEGRGEHLIHSYATRMRANSFETVMVMRFIFLPYDAVSYLAGFLQIKYWPFILATALGSIPGTLAFIGFGASIEKFDGSLPKLNPVTFGISVAVFIISLALSHLFKKREGNPK
jgi:uncharacterized membrane protein YdjX (TVP38/TMEM64 family)